MNKILSARQTGKTEKLIKMSAENGGYIVCQHQHEAQQISIRSRRLELEIPFPLTYQEFIEGQFYAKGVKSFLIDNVDLLLEYMGREVKIEAITMTVGDE